MNNPSLTNKVTIAKALGASLALHLALWGLVWTLSAPSHPVPAPAYPVRLESPPRHRRHAPGAPHGRSLPTPSRPRKKSPLPQEVSRPSGPSTGIPAPYLEEIHRKIREEIRVPRSVAGPLEAKLQVHLDFEGNLQEAHLQEPSRSHLFNRRILEAVKRAAPFSLPQLEEDKKKDGVTFVIPVRIEK